MKLAIKEVVLKLKSEGCSARRITIEDEKMYCLKISDQAINKFQGEAIGCTDSLTGVTSFFCMFDTFVCTLNASIHH